MRNAPLAASVLALSAALSAALPSCAAPGSAGDPDARRPLTAAEAAVARAQFEKIKSLAGTWVPADESEMKTNVTYRLTAGGSAVEETLFPGQPHEMVTMYHMDGDSLVLTHYCAAQNQPRMRALPSADASEIRFAFSGLSNGDPAKDMHMHEAVVKFPSPDRIEAVWTGFEDGKPGAHTARLTLIRPRK